MITSISSHRQRGVSTGELLLVIVVLTTIAYLAVPRFPDATMPAESRASETQNDLLNARCEDGGTETGDDGTQSALGADALSADPPVCPLATPYIDAGGDDRVGPHAQ